MKGFSIEIQQSVNESQNGYCRVKNCVEPIHSIHHKVANTKVNRKLYPNFIDSPMNAVGLCISCHTNNTHLFNVTDKEVRVYEDFLVKLKER